MDDSNSSIPTPQQLAKEKRCQCNQRYESSLSQEQKDNLNAQGNTSAKASNLRKKIANMSQLPENANLSVNLSAPPTMIKKTR